MSELHPNFATWYACLELQTSSEKRQLRWDGLKSLLENIDNEGIEHLVRLAFDFRQRPQTKDLNEIKQYFRDVDESFEMSGNDREVQVLAAIALALLAENPTYTSAEFAALAMTTSSFMGARKLSLPMDILKLGEAGLVILGNESRKRPDLQNLASKINTQVSFDEASKEIVSTFDEVKSAFKNVETQINDKISKSIISTILNVRKVSKFISIQDEELQMLWWLITEYSQTMDCTFKKVPADSKPLVFASELASDTTSLPGPVAIKSLLSRAGLKNTGKLKVSTAINSMPEEWLKAQIEDFNLSPLTTPIHYAIQRQLETGRGDTWIAGWEASCSISQDFSLTPLNLSLLFYRERLQILFC